MSPLTPSEYVMSNLLARYCYNNDKFVKFKMARIDSLGIRLMFPTSDYKLSTIMYSVTVDVSLRINNMVLVVTKAVGYELPGCVSEFKDLSTKIVKQLLDTIEQNIMFTPTALTVPMEIIGVQIHQGDPTTSYPEMLNFIANGSNIGEMSLKAIKYNRPMLLSATVAMTEEGGVGSDQYLPWWLPDELATFRKHTSGKLLVCGATTYKTMGPLPNRVLFVLTSSGELPIIEGNSQKGLAVPVQSYEELLAVIATTRLVANDEVCVIGGPLTFGLFEGEFDVLNKTIVSDDKLERVPNVFINPSVEFYITRPYSDGEETGTGDGWSCKTYRRD